MGGKGAAASIRGRPCLSGTYLDGEPPRGKGRKGELPQNLKLRGTSYHPMLQELGHHEVNQQ